MSSPTIVLVDTAALLDQCLSDISPTIGPQPCKLALDLEGVDLCRHGLISIVQIFADNSNVIWLVDITTLGREAFDHKDSYGQSLREVFQNPSTKKVLWFSFTASSCHWNIDYLAVFRCSKRCRCAFQHLRNRVGQCLWLAVGGCRQ